MNIDLSNKTALITGASGELGRVMALTLATCGADIIVHYLKNEQKALEVRKQITALGRKAMVVGADVSDFDSVMTIKKEVEKGLGSPDILVVNAVVQYQWTPLLRQDPKDYFSQFESCVMQSVYLTKAFVPAMIEKGKGRVIGINTECSIQCFPTQSAYVAGKRGMDGIFRVLAKEVGQHQITVNQVAPGWTISEKDRLNHTESQKAYEANVPLKRRGTDQEIANVVAFLASDLASFITGAYIPVSGGNVMPAI